MSCPDCFRGAVREGQPLGTEKVLHGVRTYIAGNVDTQYASLSTVIFITDAFGFNLVNSKLLADIYASKTGFRVLVPDIIPGGGVPLYSLQLMERMSNPVKWWNIFGHVKRVFTILRMMTLFIPFVYRTRNVFPAILSYARSIKAELPAGRKLGAAGFCWGGLHTTKLAQQPSTEGGSQKLLDAHFTAHPSGLKVPDDIVTSITKYNVPFSLAVGDRDFILSRQTVENIEATLLMKIHDGENHHYEIKIYPECSHGFSVRADPKKTVEDEAAEQASDQAISWLRKYLSEM